MFDLTDVLDPKVKTPSVWVVPPRTHSVDQLVGAIVIHRVVFVVGGHGVGKSTHTRAAVARIEQQNNFAIHVESSSELVSKELEQLLAAATPSEQILVALDKPHRLPQKTLELLDAKIRSGACSAFVECTSRATLPQSLQALGHEVSSESVEIEPLNEVETFERLRGYFSDSIAAESAYLLWYRTGGNQELLSKWTPHLAATGEYKRGKYAWHWNGRTQPAGAVFDHVQRQYEQLPCEQQSFAQYLALAGALPRNAVAQIVSDSDLAALQTAGIVLLETGRDNVIRARFSASVWSEVIQAIILPARRHEIFKGLPQPSEVEPDPIADFAWSVAALQDGYRMVDAQLLRGAQAAYILHAWEFVDMFAAVRFPTTASQDDHIASFAHLDAHDQRIALELLLVRARTYYQTSQRDLATYDLDLARAIVDGHHDSLESNIPEINRIQVAVLRGASGNIERISHRYDSQIQRAESKGDYEYANLLRIQSHSAPAANTDMQAQRERLVTLFSDEEAYSSEALSLLPELIYLTGLAGQLDEALAMADRALQRRTMQNLLSVEHAYPMVYAEIVSARFMITLWQGQVGVGFHVPDVQASINLVDSALFQTGLGRTLAVFGQWEEAKPQYEGALERFVATDPLGRRKYALGGYVQALAALGLHSELKEALKEYDGAEFLTSELISSDSEYLVLTAIFAAQLPGLDERLDSYLEQTQTSGLWYSVLKGAHLGVVSSQGRRRSSMCKLLKEAAQHVDDEVAQRFLNDAEAVVGGVLGEQNKARAELLSFGVWVPQPEAGIKLTRRQKQILELVARGLTNKEIAAKLVLSVRTVDAHVSSILARTGADDRRTLSAKVQHLL